MSNSDIASLTDKELWTIFRDGLSQAVDGIRRAADAWVILEDRGVDVARFRSPLTMRLRAVAKGRMSAAALLRFSGTAGILDAITGINLDEQDRMALADYRVTLVRDSGEVSDVRPDDLSVPEIKRVFGNGFIRTPDEQRKLIPAVSPAVAWLAGNADKFPGKFAATPGADNQALYAALGLQPRQQAALAAAALSAGVTVATLIVRTLRGAELIPGKPGREKRAA